MAAELRSDPAISAEVADALAVVPREVFAPGQPLEAVYDPHGIVAVKRDETGRAISAVSAPHLQATMLTQAEIAPGMRVLEIGSGGYNAALAAHLTGPGGFVTTVDIDPDITERATGFIAAAGYSDRVRVVLADATRTEPEGGPFDRIIVTAGAWDIAPAWLDQLTADGRLVVPLRFRGLTRTIAFEWDGDGLAGRDYKLCSFVPMQGDGAGRECFVALADGVTLCTDEPAESFDTDGLAAALRGPWTTQWAGVEFDAPDETALYTLTNDARSALLFATSSAAEAHRAPAPMNGLPTLVHGASIAYQTKRADPKGRFEFEAGVRAAGPEADTLAAAYVELLRSWWLTCGRRGAAQFRYQPGQTVPGDEPNPGVIVKPHGVLTISWP